MKFRYLVWSLIYTACVSRGATQTSLKEPSPGEALAEPSDSKMGLKPFSTDGCSLFPEGGLLKPNLWCECCLAHDILYWKGGTRKEKEEADAQFNRCVTEKSNNKLLGNVMKLAVKMGGQPMFPTWFRWGYGWPVGRGYQALNRQEQKQAETKLYDFRFSNLPNICAEPTLVLGTQLPKFEPIPIKIAGVPQPLAIREPDPSDLLGDFTVLYRWEKTSTTDRCLALFYRTKGKTETFVGGRNLVNNNQVKDEKFCKDLEPNEMNLNSFIFHTRSDGQSLCWDRKNEAIVDLEWCQK
jgi:hypothetical protein